jgi:hypothetical protein
MRKGKIQGSCGTSTRGRLREDGGARTRSGGAPFPPDPLSPDAASVFSSGFTAPLGPIGQPAYTAPPTRLKRVWLAGWRRGFAQQACGKARPAFIYKYGNPNRRLAISSSEMYRIGGKAAPVQSTPTADIVTSQQATTLLALASIPGMQRIVYIVDLYALRDQQKIQSPPTVCTGFKI